MLFKQYFKLNAFINGSLALEYVPILKEQLTCSNNLWEVKSKEISYHTVYLKILASVLEVTRKWNKVGA